MNKDNKGIRLTPEQFKYLGSLLDTERSPISPLPAHGEKVDLAEDLKKQLADSGQLDASGAITHTARMVYELFSGAEAFARVSVGLAPFLEVMVFFCGKERAAILTGTEDVTVFVGDEPDSLPALIAEHIGRTNLCALELDEVFSSAEAVAVSACIDERRRQLLSAIADDASGRAYPILTEEIDSRAGNGGVQWISSHVREYIGGEVALSDSDIDTALAAIVGKGMIAEHGEGYVCSEQLEAVAARCLVVNNKITIQGSSVAEAGAVMTTHMEVLRFGLTEMLLLENSGADELHLSAVSPDTALAVITDLVTNPHALDELAVSEEVSLKESVKCASCGGQLEKTVKFCPDCGMKVDNVPPLPANICKNCGAKLQPDDKFCIECGTKA